MIPPNRLAHVFVASRGRDVVRAWVEGGGAPIILAPPLTDLDEVGQWAVENGSVGVIVRRRGPREGLIAFDEELFWWGPGDVIPFNKAEVLPIAALAASETRARRRSFLKTRPLEPDRLMAFWSDRAWSSLHPEKNHRRRPAFPNEIAELRERLQVEGEFADVVVSRNDVFLEGPPHLRGMIRMRALDGLKRPVSDGEDAVNENFLHGPPPDIQLDPPA